MVITLKEDIYALCHTKDTVGIQNALEGRNLVEIEKFDEDLYRYPPESVQLVISTILKNQSSSYLHDCLFLDFFLQLNRGTGKPLSNDQLGENIFKLLVRLGGAKEDNINKIVIPFEGEEKFNFIENLNFLMEKLPYSSNLWNQSIPPDMHAKPFFEKVIWIYQNNPTATDSGRVQYTNNWYPPSYLEEVLESAIKTFNTWSLEKNLRQHLPPSVSPGKKTKI